MLASDGPRRNNYFFPAGRIDIVPIQSLIAAAGTLQGQTNGPVADLRHPQGPDLSRGRRRRRGRAQGRGNCWQPAQPSPSTARSCRPACRQLLDAQRITAALRPFDASLIDTHLLVIAATSDRAVNHAVAAAAAHGAAPLQCGRRSGALEFHQSLDRGSLTADRRHLERRTRTGARHGCCASNSNAGCRCGSARSPTGLASGATRSRHDCRNSLPDAGSGNGPSAARSARQVLAGRMQAADDSAAQRAGCSRPMQTAHTARPGWSAPDPAIPNCSACAAFICCSTPMWCCTTGWLRRNCWPSRAAMPNSSMSARPVAVPAPARPQINALLLDTGTRRQTRLPAQGRRSLCVRPRQRRS